MPARVLGHGRVDVCRDEPERRGRELPLERVAVRVAERLELLQVGELPDVDLDDEVAPNRLLQGLAGLEVAAREGPRAKKGLAGSLPEQRLQATLPHPQHDRQRDVGRTLPGRLL